MKPNFNSPKVHALVTFLQDDGEEVSADDLTVSSYDKSLFTFNTGSREYLVLTDAEANKRAADNIKNSVWSFKPEFVASHSKISYDATIQVCKALQEKCEGSNDDITALIKSMKKFVSDAIRGDGRGHFMNSYDGEEHEVKVGAKRYYIYRVN